MDTVLNFLELVGENWFTIFAGGIVLALIGTAIPKSEVPALSAMLRAASRLAISVPIALVLGVPAAFVGLVVGTMGVLYTVGLLLLVLLVWASMPLIQLLDSNPDGNSNGSGLDLNSTGEKSNKSVSE